MFYWIIFPKKGIDFANSRTKDFVDVKNWDKSDIDRVVDQRMPWYAKILISNTNKSINKFLFPNFFLYF